MEGFRLLSSLQKVVRGCRLLDRGFVWRGRRLDRAAGRRLDLVSLKEKSVSIKISQLILPISHTRYYIQPPCIPWPSLLVANARPHPAMTFSLVVPLLVGEDSAPLLRRPSGGWFRLSSIRCVPTY